MDRIGHEASALYPLGSLGEVKAAAGHWRNALILFGAVDTLVQTMGYPGAFLSDDVAHEASIKRAIETQLGAKATAKARAIGEGMTYREAVDFAFEINGVTPP